MYLTISDSTYYFWEEMHWCISCYSDYQNDIDNDVKLTNKIWYIYDVDEMIKKLSEFLLNPSLEEEKRGTIINLLRRIKLRSIRIC